MNEKSGFFAALARRISNASQETPAARRLGENPLKNVAIALFEGNQLGVHGFLCIFPNNWG
ncbi:MAG: hypothetical protein QNI90_09965 [Dinoroseobacter sp.]|nr:hypothetical protein [Dinoroseobacter sp.]